MPERDAFGLWKDDDRKVGVYDKTIGLIANKSKNIQIEPLKIPTNKHLLAACRGDLANLSLIIEGIKTEMQWVTKFMEATNGQVRILNANQLLLYYKTQVERLEQVLNNPEKYLGKMNSTFFAVR